MAQRGMDPSLTVVRSVSACSPAPCQGAGGWDDAWETEGALGGKPFSDRQDAFRD